MTRTIKSIIGRTINSLTAQDFTEGETSAALLVFKEQTYKLETTFRKIEKRCAGKIVTWQDIKAFSIQYNNFLSAEQKLELHRRSFRNS